MKKVLIVLAFMIGGVLGYVSVQMDFEVMKEIQDDRRTDVVAVLDQEVALLDQLIDHAEVLEQSAFAGNVLDADVKKSTRADRTSRKELLERRKRLKERRERLKKKREAEREREQLPQDSKVEIALRSWEKQEKVSQTVDELWSDKASVIPDDIQIQVLDRRGMTKPVLRDIHKAQVVAALELMPEGFDKRLKKLIFVRNDPQMSRRGMSGPGRVFIKEENDDIFSVLIHEFAHIWDFHAETLTGALSEYGLGQYRFYAEDPSIDYYELSWDDAFQPDEDKQAYASGYAMTKYYEDFAEAMTLYVLQNKTFSQWALENPTMAKKYEYMRSLYNNSRNESRYLYEERPFDVTKMPFELEDVL